MLRVKYGFTLVELLIALLVMGILTAIAYPSYTNYVLRSQRKDAHATLMQDQTIMERCYAQNFSYSGACTGLPTFPQTSAQGYYRVALSNVTATTYTLTATPLGVQTRDTTCASLIVNQANQKTAFDTSGTAQPTCWTM